MVCPGPLPMVSESPGPGELDSSFIHGRPILSTGVKTGAVAASKRKRCNGAPFAELICRFSEVKATAKFPRMRLMKPPPELAEENKERRQDWRMGGLRAHLRLSHAPRRDGRRTGGEKRSAADWLPAKVRLGNTR